jgi:hypothetical protein
LGTHLPQQAHFSLNFFFEIQPPASEENVKIERPQDVYIKRLTENAGARGLWIKCFTQINPFVLNLQSFVDVAQ